MAQDHEQKLKATKSTFYLWLSVVTLVAISCIFGAVAWKLASRDSREKLLILQIGQSIASAGAHPADGSVAQPTKFLTDLIKELVTESGQQDSLGLDLLRDLGIALLIAVVVTVLIERYASDRLSQHLAVDVLSAAYGKVIPERIYSQVATMKEMARIFAARNARTRRMPKLMCVVLRLGPEANAGNSSTL